MPTEPQDYNVENRKPRLRRSSAPSGFRGHDVVDHNHRLIGTISDVVYDTEREPHWAVVDLGLLASSHYVPIAGGHMTGAGEFVVPYDKQVVKAAPKAERDHRVDSTLTAELIRHYELD